MHPVVKGVSEIPVVASHPRGQPLNREGTGAATVTSVAITSCSLSSERTAPEPRGDWYTRCEQTSENTCCSLSAERTTSEPIEDRCPDWCIDLVYVTELTTTLVYRPGVCNRTDYPPGVSSGVCNRTDYDPGVSTWCM